MNREVARARDAAERLVGLCDRLVSMLPGDIDDFVGDVRSQWAAEMGLIRIGETVNRIPAEVLAAYPDQPWASVIGMRNFAAHQYDDLDPRRVWRTVTRDVPALRTYVDDVLLPGLADPPAGRV